MMMLTMTTVMMAKDIRTLVVTTNPQMHCQKCENRVITNLANVKGIKSVETSVADQTVTIIYDAKKVSEEDLIAAIDASGFKARRLAEGEVIQKEAHECKNEAEEEVVKKEAHQCKNEGGDHKCKNEGGDHKCKNEGGDHKCKNEGGDHKCKNEGGDHKCKNDGGDHKCKNEAEGGGCKE